MLRPFNYSIALLFYLLKASKFLIDMSHICAICTIHLDTLLTLLKNKKGVFIEEVRQNVTLEKLVCQNDAPNQIVISIYLNIYIS